MPNFMSTTQVRPLIPPSPAHAHALTHSRACQVLESWRTKRVIDPQKLDDVLSTLSIAHQCALPSTGSPQTVRHELPTRRCPMHWLRSIEFERWALEVDGLQPVLAERPLWDAVDRSSGAPLFFRRAYKRVVLPVPSQGIAIPWPRFRWPTALFRESPRRALPDLESESNHPTRSRLPHNDPARSSMPYASCRQPVTQIVSPTR